MLLLAAFVGGAGIMIVEILGSRVLGPFFGVGLFVWSALLAVTLTALALGYYAGGVLADRKPVPTRVFVLLVASGCLVALVPPAAAFVLKLTDGLGIRWGTLASATVLLGPSLTTLGMVTTSAVRSAARDPNSTGKSAGLVYAVSTLGSLAGTLLAGFILVPRWAVNSTLSVTAVALILTGVAGWVVHRGKRAIRFLPLLALPWLALPAPPAFLAEGIRVLERSESLLGRLSVVQDDTRREPLRLLRVDHSFIGGRWTDTGDPAFSFVHLLEAVRLARPEGRRLLQIGLGVGSLSASMARAGVRTDVVEIDPEVVRLASAHFHYRATGEVAIEDARTFIRRPGIPYDFIVHDTFTGGAVPEHLLSLEVLQRLRTLLVPGGVLALNIVGAESGPLSAVTRAVNKTLQVAFPHVRVFRDGPNIPRENLSNIVFFASSEPIRFHAAPSFESDRCRNVLTAFQAWEFSTKVDSDAPLILDASNPLARLTLPISAAFRESMRALYPPSFWLQ